MAVDNKKQIAAMSHVFRAQSFRSFVKFSCSTSLGMGGAEIEFRIANMIYSSCENTLVL